MTATLRFSVPVDYDSRIIIPIIRDNAFIIDNGCMAFSDPVGLVIMEEDKAWFVPLSEEVTMETIDGLLGITE